MKKILRPLELFFRHAIAYPILRLIFRNQNFPGKINLKRVNKVLILRYDRIGDVIVTTPAFRSLKKANPNCSIGVFCSPSNAELIRFHPCVDQIYVLHPNWWRLFREIQKARKEQYDVVLNLIFNRTTSGGILANLIVPRGTKVGQGAEKYRFYFNKLLRLPRADRHMVEILSFFLFETFGLRMRTSAMKMEIVVDPDAENAVTKFLENHVLTPRSARPRNTGRFCVFNLSATDTVRKITHSQASAIADVLSNELAWNTVIISSPSESEWRNRIVREAGSSKCIAYPPVGSGTLREIAVLIDAATFVVTPDTSIVHFSSATGTPVLGFFTHLQMAVEWLPFKVRNKIVFAPDGEPVSAISEEVIGKELKDFVKSLKISKARKR